MRWAAIAVLVIAATAGAAHVAGAHPASTGFVQLDVASGDGRVELPVVDLDAVLAIDRDGDGHVTSREVDAAQSQIRAYVDARLAVNGCAVVVGDGEIVRRSEGAYWAASFRAACVARDDELAVTYRELFELDARHIALVAVDDELRVVRTTDPDVRVALAPPPPAAASIRAGAIESGARFDHWLFVACVMVWLVVAGVRRPIAMFAIVIAGELVGAAASTWLVAPSAHATLVVAAWTTLIAAAGAAARIGARDACAVAPVLGVAHGLAYEAPAVTAASQFLGISLGQLAVSFVLTAALSWTRPGISYRIVCMLCLTLAFGLFIYRCAT